MSKDKAKSSALKMLRAQASPIALTELVKALGTDYPERTLRRWLAEWVKIGIVQKTGEKRGTRYIAVQDRAMESAANYFSPESKKALEHIKLPYPLRKPVTYQPSWLKEYRPNVDSYLSPTQQAQLYEAGDRAKKYTAAGTYARKIYNRLLIDLSYNSSRLEGNTYSLLDTKKLILEGTESPGKLDEEKTMILNHKEAIRFLVDNSDHASIEINTIYTLHFLLSDGLIAPQYSGKIRDYGVRIGGSTYIPLENPNMLESHMHEICNKANLIKNPHEKSIFLLAHIAYLQAFVDINKRTARLSANIPLINENLVPLSFDAIQQSDYTDAMIAIYESNKIAPLVDLYIHSYLRTATSYDVTVEAIGFDRVRVEYRQPRREIIKHIIENNLHSDEMKTFINSKIKKFIPEGDQSQVARNIDEDLNQLGVHNIAGMGLTIEQLNKWVKNKS